MKRLILSLATLAALAAGPALADTLVYASPQVSVVYESGTSYVYDDFEPPYYVEYRTYARPVTHYHRHGYGARYHQRHYAGCGHPHRRGHGHHRGHGHGHRY